MAKILCVEDEADIRSEIVEELLDCGYEVEQACNGLTGLKAAVEFRPDVILCDCLMPAMTGPEMIAALRRDHPELRATPFVLISAYTGERHLADAKAAGAAACLTKPMDFDELESILAQLLHAPQSPAARPERADGSAPSAR